MGEIKAYDIENIEKLKDYIKPSKVNNLHILQNGNVPPNPSELLSSKAMKNLVKIFKCMYDIVILDGTECSIVSDSIGLSTMVDTTILVAENKKTKIKELKNVKKSILSVNGKILGVILNKVELKKEKGYGYGYYYGYTANDNHKSEDEDINLLTIESVIEEAKTKFVLNIEEYAEEVIKEIEQKEDNKNDIKENSKNNNKEFKFIKEKITEICTKVKDSFNAYSKRFKYIEDTQDDNKKQIIFLKEELEKKENQIQYLKEMYQKNIEEFKQIQQENIRKFENLEAFRTEIKKTYHEIREMKELQVQNKEKREENTLAETNKKWTDNIINFELFKKKKNTTKNVFYLDEEISFEDLEKNATSVIYINDYSSNENISMN